MSESQDALRYRYLREHCYKPKYPGSDVDYSMQVTYTVSGVWANCQDPAVLDSLIDAAIERLSKK